MKKHKLAYQPTVKLAELLPQLATEVQDSLLDRFGDEVGELDVKRIATSSRPTIKGERQVLINVSTRDMDRDREILLPQGADFSEFKMTGVVVDSHDYFSIDKILGHAVEMGKDEKAVPMVIEFLPTPMGELALTIAQHMPLTASVGFIPMEIAEKGSDQFAKLAAKFGEFPEFKKNRDKVERFITKWLLLEVSIVSVPANAHALQSDVSKALKSGAITGEEAQLVIKGYSDLQSKATGNEPEDGKADDDEKPEDAPEDDDEQDENDEEEKKAAEDAPEKKAVKVEVVKTPSIEVVGGIEVVDAGKGIASVVENCIAIKSGKV